MKVAIIGNPVTSGSNEVFLKKFLRILIPLSQKIFIISLWKTKLSSKEIRIIPPGRFIPGSFPTRNIIGRIIRYILLQLTICKKLLTTANDAQVSIVFPLPMILPALLLRMMRKKVVFLAAGRPNLSSSSSRKFSSRVQKHIIEFLKTIAFSLANKIIAESKSLIKWLNLTRYKDKILIGQTFVDTTHFQVQRELDKRENVVGYIGILSESKGVVNFTKSIPAVLEVLPSARFFIGGSGLCLSEIERLVDTLGISDKLKLVDWIPHSEVPSYLNKLRLLLLPSESEGLPNIVLEAMACGTPVLAAPVGAIPDVIIHEETGFLLNNTTKTEIAEAIIQALQSRLLKEISKNARTLVEHAFSYESAVRRYSEILSSIA
jgi:glycosyltransferase involved in cell wall biosynthesis